MACSLIYPTGATTSGSVRTISAGAETLAGGSIYFWADQGTELPVSGVTVSPATTATRLIVDQDEAQIAAMADWGSGKPGTSARLWLVNYPAGWVNDILGQADYPITAGVNDFGTVTTNGDEYDGQKMVTIPRTAAPGYAYWVLASHQNGPLSLVTSFQTCTLRPSAATVRKGAMVTLRGVVLIQGHYGSRKGTPKYVTLYRTTSTKTASHQPYSKGGGTVKGWIRMGKVVLMAWASTAGAL